ncbi:MAG TPA: hypothetical protein VE130_00190 [Nitrososphaeraceae archaeon]|jgi:uncharacterized coiled-coil DUF342 family protein|nr:hypothetical protein [Nitrososphaeraceae archaeon]
MGGKLNDIRETSSNAIQLIRDLKSPEVHESLNRAKDISATAREIVESFKDPSMVKNIENIRLTVESIDRISSRIDNLRGGAQNSDLMDEISRTIRACRTALDNLNNEGGTKELVNASRNLISEISSMVLEIRQLLHTIGSTEGSTDIAGIIGNVKDIHNYTKSIRDDFK